ncbi:MAG: hypothetical protein QW356_02130 [Candidatus Hadarchaeales archaeon]
MKYKIVHGLYRDYSTHWYYGHDEKGDICTSTRKGDLPRVDGDVWVSPDERVILCYCPKCETVHDYEGCYSEFYFQAAEKARDCEEYKNLSELFRSFRKLAWEYIQGKNTLAESDIGYVAERVKKGAHLSVLERLFIIPDEVRAKILARVL